MTTSALAVAACLIPHSTFAQTPKATSTDIWSQATLTGNWGGVRDDLEKRGITFSLNYTSEVQSNLRGGIKTGTVVNGLFQPQIDFDLDKLWQWHGASARTSAILTHGPGLTTDYVGNLMTISNIEANSATRFYEVWYKQAFLNGRLTAQIGLVDSDDFMASDTAALFINNTFGWNTLFGDDLPGGGPAYPLSAPALRIRATPTDELYVHGAVYSGDPTGGNGSNQMQPLPRGTVISFNGGAFFIGEVGYSPKPAKESEGYSATYKFGGWVHTSSRFGDQHFDNLGLSLADPRSPGIPLNHFGDWALYAVADRTLYHKGDETLSGFIRIAGTRSDRNLIDFYVDGGLVYTGLIPHRPDDKIGVAVAYARISNSARALDQDVDIFTGSAIPIRTAETAIEATYQAKVSPSWTVQGDLQYIIRPNGGVLNDDGKLRQNAVVVGARSVVSF